MSKKPEVDLGCCTRCEGCLEICPEVFFFNPAGDYLEVAEMDSYPEDKVREAMAICPEDCITWVKS